MKKDLWILVTGGAGFIGSHLVDFLVGKGISVRVLDNFSSGRIENIRSNVEVLRRDLKNFDDIVDVFNDIDFVFHFAANPEVRVSTTHPRIHFEENVLSTFNLLEAMRKNDVKYLVFASSSSVYGEPDHIPVSENDPVKPVSVYGATKASCENLIHAYSILYGIRSICLRYANVVGPRLRHGVIYDFIMKLKKDPGRLEILGDGMQTRSYIYIDDAVIATVFLAERITKNFDVYNIGSIDWITVNDVARITVETLGLKNVSFSYKPILHGVGWRGDVKRIALSIEKLRKAGFTPRFKSREAVKKTVEYLMKELF